MLVYRDFQSEISEKLKENYPDIGEQDLSPDRTGHGDYALRLFRLAKSEDYGKICTGVKQLFSGNDDIETIDCRGPYINFRIKASSMLSAITDSIDTTGQFPDTFQDPERVVVEHTSTNPTGPIHVGRSRNSIIGDSIAKLFSRVGYRVTTQYFVNDSGRQVMAMLLGNRLYYSGKRDRESLLKGYQKIYEELEQNPALEEQLKEITRKYEAGDQEIIAEVREICTVGLQSIKESLQKIGIKIDDYVFESGFIAGGETEEVLENLEEDLKTEGSREAVPGDSRDIVSEEAADRQAGARYVDTPYGRKIYLQRSDGTSLYTLRDIAYHVFKALNADWVIDVLGEDHKDHGKGLSYVLNELLDYRAKLDFVFYAFVSLESGKMSTRKGRIVTLDDLIEKAVEEAEKTVREKRSDIDEDKIRHIAETVGVSSVKFNMVRVNPDKAMVFRWSEALSFEGDSAPYIMYSYARTSGILSKAADTAAEAHGEFNDEERDLVRTMYFYPYFLHSAWQSIRPDGITGYILDLVKSFTDFYAKHSVIKAEPQDRGRRLLLVKTYRKIIEDACRIAGINLLDEM